jgi:ATP-dependent Clp protease ATP-binding subunit ClpA
MKNKLSRESVEMKRIISGIVRSAEEIAKTAGHSLVQPEHLMSAVLGHIASETILNKQMEGKIRNLEAEIEALRRAVSNMDGSIEKKDEATA